MTRTAIVTDSTCNLPLDLAASRQIYVTPLYVIWGDTTYRDGLDLSEPEFFRRLEENKEIPTTSQACAPDFLTVFEQVRQNGADEIVCAVISSDLSGTYASALQAREMVDYPVHVVDTRQVTWGLGFAVLSGATARDQGADAATIAQVIRDAAAQQHIIFTIESLEFLHRGGRIGNARLLLGSALRIKPILTIQNGIVESAENARTRKRAVERLVKVAEDYAAGRKVRRAAVLHGDVEEEARALMASAAERFQPDECYLSYACTTIGVHTGPGVLGLVVDCFSR